MLIKSVSLEIDGWELHKKRKFFSRIFFGTKHLIKINIIQKLRDRKEPKDYHFEILEWHFNILHRIFLIYDSRQDSNTRKCHRRKRRARLS